MDIKYLGTYFRMSTVQLRHIQVDRPTEIPPEEVAAETLPF
jgi:hypothetical protein